MERSTDLRNPPSERHHLRRLITLLLLVLLAVKIAATLARGPVAIEMDAFGYWQLSSLVLSGDLLMLDRPIAFRTPGYPYFLAIVRAINGSGALWSMVLIQGVLTLATIVIAALLAGRITSLPRAVPLTLAAALPAVSALTFSAALLSETLFVFLMLLNMWAVVAYARHGTAGCAAWVGVTLGLTLLTRPIAMLLWIPHLILLLFIHFRRWRLSHRTPFRDRIKLRHRTGHALVAVGVIGLLLAPWLVRNQHLFGSPQLTEFVGRNVWVVTFQAGSGAGLELPDSEAGDEIRQRLDRVGAAEDWRNTWQVSNALVASGLNDAQADRLMKQVARDAIATHPELFAQKAFRRTVNFWRCAATDLPRQGGEQNYRGQRTWHYEVPPIDWAIEHRWSQSVWGNTLLTAILGLATMVLIVNYPTRPYGIWLLLIFSYFAVVTGVLEIPAYRYRMVIEPLVALTLGAATAVMLSRVRKTAVTEVAK
jgi:hypothetical protein